MHKIYSIIICILTCWNTFSQEPQKQLYTASELQNDFDYYLGVLNEVHPDLYAFTSKENFEKQIKHIKHRLNKPMNAYDFGRIVAELNHCLDGHSGIPLHIIFSNPSSKYKEEIEAYQKQGRKFLPLITIQGTKAYFNAEEIISINQKKMKEIIETLNLYYTKADSPNFSDWNKMIDFSEYGLSYFFFDLQSPFYIVTKNSSGKTKTYNEEGWTSEDYRSYKEKNGYREQPSVNCDFYIKDSIACINWNDGFIEPDLFKVSIDSIFTMIDEHQIQNLFINITQNTGGYAHGYELLNKIKHKAFDWKYKRSDKISKAYIKRFNLSTNRLQLTGDKMLNYNSIHHQKGVNSGFTGMVYILQGPWTYSNGDDFARLAKASGRCVLVGAPTGQRNRMIINYLKFKMPHSQLTFQCSCKDFTYFDCDDNGLCPDIPFPVGIYKNHFAKDELLEILRLYKETTNN